MAKHASNNSHLMLQSHILFCCNFKKYQQLYGISYYSTRNRNEFIHCKTLKFHYWINCGNYISTSCLKSHDQRLRAYSWNHSIMYMGVITMFIDIFLISYIAIIMKENYYSPSGQQRPSAIKYVIVNKAIAWNLQSTVKHEFQSNAVH